MNKLYRGDAITVLRRLLDCSVQCVVTSPPYWGLRDYGVAGQLGLESTPEAYVARMVEVFSEVRRVLREDGTLWLNMGDSYAHNGACGGGSVFANGRTDGRVFYEVGQKGGDNPSKAREATKRASVVPPGLRPKDLVGIPWRLAFALQADGWYLRSDIIWHKPNPMPESVRDRPTKAHEYVFLLTKSDRYFWDQEAVRERVGEPTRRQKTFRGGCYTNNATFDNSFDYTGHEPYSDGPDSLSGRNIRSVWTITPKPFRGAHFATFPPALVERCIRAGSASGDTVLDPFIGSGTVAVVARSLGRDCIGIDLNPKYITMARTRIKAVPKVAICG